MARPQTTQKEVALVAGATEERIIYWETGFAQPPIEHAPKVIEFLGYKRYKGKPKPWEGGLRTTALCMG